MRSTHSVIEYLPTAEDRQIARLAALAVGLAVVEAGLPSPIPGIKPGLANVVTLVVLARLGWRAAVWVTLLRVLAGGLVLGSFLAPGFFLSLSGAISSLAMLGLTTMLPARWFGPVSQSILAAFAHVLGQLALAYFWLVPHAAVWYLLPLFGVAAWLFGLSNGLLCAHLLQRNDGGERA